MLRKMNSRSISLFLFLLARDSTTEAFLALSRRTAFERLSVVAAAERSENDVVGPAKTYGTSEQNPIRDLIDSEAAMGDFFSCREEWAPLFRSVAGKTDDSSSFSASTFLGDHDASFDMKTTVGPWRLLEAIPTDDKDRQVVAGFLDAMQQSLLDIPVTDSEKDDENDLHFVEEGRRMLALTRFQVLRENQGGSLESYDKLFSTCWSELHYLSSTAEEHTGSLILLPDYDLSDLRRFTDMNLLRPLEWLGVHGDFEITSMQRESPAIRLLYKLTDIPTLKEEEDEGQEME